MKASLLRQKAMLKNAAVSSACPTTEAAAGASHHARLAWRMRSNTWMSSSCPST